MNTDTLPDLVNERLSDTQLEALARRGRWLVLSTAHAVKSGHVGGSMSAMDILVALYFDALRIDPAKPSWAERDRFILSKGHCGIGLYTVLAMRGYLPIEECAVSTRAARACRCTRTCSCCRVSTSPPGHWAKGCPPGSAWRSERGPRDRRRMSSS